MAPPSASFGRDVASLPASVVDGDRQLPRNRRTRAYVGLGTWNSRVLSLSGAVGAMLGDSSARPESPALALRRLQLMHGGRESPALQAARASLIYPTCCNGGDFGGLGLFNQKEIREERAPHLMCLC